MPLQDELAAYRTFADTEPTKEGVTVFVREYGPLGVWESLDTGPGPAVRGEALMDWTGEILAMKDALDVWDCYKEDNTKQLAKWIRFGPSGRAFSSVVFERPDRGTIIVGENDRPELWPYVLDARKGDALKLAGLFFVQGEINQRLTEHAAPRLLYNPSSGCLELRLWPKNLLGALWVQFGRAVDGGKNYERCSTCGKWFEVSPEGMRPDAKYCSVNCRVRAGREREAETIRRGRAGEDVESIAELIGSNNPDTVRRWLQAAGIKPVEKSTRRGRRKTGGKK